MLPSVISASRRTDLVACYPDCLLQSLREFSPQQIHSVVIWTKDPGNLIFYPNLMGALKRFKQTFIHLTITGLGGTVLEPSVPPTEEVVRLLPDLIDIVQTPGRLHWRFDPLITVKDISTGEQLGNIDDDWSMFRSVAGKMVKAGIKDCHLSWATLYPKVQRRLKKKGQMTIEYSLEERKSQAETLYRIAKELGINLNFCCVEGFPVSRCIDGELLTRLHPEGAACSVKKDRTQRKLCGCTESRDIGAYSLSCRKGCIYCYANPSRHTT